MLYLEICFSHDMKKTKPSQLTTKVSLQCPQVTLILELLPVCTFGTMGPVAAGGVPPTFITRLLKVTKQLLAISLKHILKKE